MASALEKVSAGLGDVIGGVIKAVRTLPEDEIKLWLKSWNTIIDNVKDLGLETEGKTVKEVLGAVKTVNPQYPIVVNVALHTEGYLADASQSGFNFSFGGGHSTYASISLGYTNTSEKREAGNVGVSMNISYNEITRPMPFAEIGPMLWSDFIYKLENFDFLAAS